MEISSKWEYVLVQQTPMIHFQYAQSGAAIRGSELKPKLDRFLAGKKKDIPKEWKIGKTEALNYKVRIIADSEPERSNTVEQKISGEAFIGEKKNINPMYFGNMVSKDKKDELGSEEAAVRACYRETVFYKKPLKIVFICFVKELRELIDENIDEFFMITNFGTRQSKGFGKFLTKRTLSGISETTLKEKLNGRDYIYAETAGNASYQKKMEYCRIIYTLMKGGFNLTGWDNNAGYYRFPNDYIKGYLQRQYLDDNGLKNTGSDKAFMKSQILPVLPTYTVNPNRKEPNNSYEKYIFVRALLGLADGYEFRDDMRCQRNARNKLVAEKVSVSNKNDNIARFKSPLTINVIGDFLVFVFDDSYKEILGKTFEFRSKYGKKTIKTPTLFDCRKFLIGFITYFNAEKSKLKKFDIQNDRKNLLKDVSKLDIKKGWQ